MNVATGTSIFKGIAIGRLRICRKETAEASPTSTLTPQAEFARFQTAQKAAQEQLGQLYEKALGEVGEDNAAIFEIHQMMLEDEDYVDAIRSILDRQGATAEYAVTAAGEKFAATFAAMEDPYLQARAADVKDISRRVVNILAGADTGTVLGDEPAILATDDLTPSETVQLDRSKLLGFITRGAPPTATPPFWPGPWASRPSSGWTLTSAGTDSWPFWTATTTACTWTRRQSSSPPWRPSARPTWSRRPPSRG